jgi:hypothetical protein
MPEPSSLDWCPSSRARVWGKGRMEVNIRRNKLHRFVLRDDAGVWDLQSGGVASRKAPRNVSTPCWSVAVEKR